MNAPNEPVVEPLVLAETSGPIKHLTLNRGGRYNPLSLEMIDALQNELDHIAEDHSVRVVIIAGAGKGFSAGHDLKEMQAFPDAEWQDELFSSCARMMVKLTRMPQPVIAKVHGIATAAGCQLVSMCDLAIASDDTRFALSGINAGIFCSTPAVGVGRNVSRKRVMEMLLTGEMIDAATALSWGLVNRVVPLAELDQATNTLAKTLAARSPAALALGKRVFYEQIETGLEAAYEVAGEAMVCNVLDPDGQEGIDAFVAKRAPNWRSM